MTAFVEVKVAELSAWALRYAVAVAEGLEEELRWHFREDGSVGNIWVDDHGAYWPDELWEIGGPLIEKYKPWLSPPVRDPDQNELYGWDAEIYDASGSEVVGHAIGCPSALVAVCRAVVLAKLGPTVSVPAELVGGV